MTRTSWAAVGLALAVLLCASGCARALRTGLSLVGLGSPYATGISEEDLRQALDRYARRFAVGVGSAAERIEQETGDGEIRRRALLWRVRMLPAIQQAAAASPRQAFTGLLTLAIAQRKYLVEGEGASLFGTLQPAAVEEAQALEEEALAVGDLFMTDEERDGVRWQVEDLTWKYPIRGVFQVEATLEGVAKSESWGSFAWVVAIPLAPLRALEGVDTGAQAILEFNATAREFARLTAQLPQMLRWESQLLAYDLETRETVRSTVGAFELAAESANRLSEAAERLPAAVRHELATVLADLEARRTALGETLREGRTFLAALDETMRQGGTLAASLQSLGEQVERAGATWTTLVREARGPEPAPEAAPSRPFDITEYERTLARAESAVSELRALLRDLDGARPPLRNLLDGVLWRLVVLVAAVFALRLAFRALERRLGRNRAR